MVRSPAARSRWPWSLAYFSPVHLVDEAPDGTRHARFPRALCRFETSDGRTGVGWTEWNQPVD